jgi:hypothetical protein
MKNVNPIRILIVIVFIALMFALGAQAAVPVINENGLLTEVTDANGRTTLANSGGVTIAHGYVYSEISTPVGTFIRVPDLTAKPLIRFSKLRDDENYWTYVFVANAETGESRLFRVTTPTFFVGTDGTCQISPCAPSASYYAFAVIVHRASAALTYVGGE